MILPLELTFIHKIPAAREYRTLGITSQDHKSSLCKYLTTIPFHSSLLQFSIGQYRFGVIWTHFQFYKVLIASFAFSATRTPIFLQVKGSFGTKFGLGSQMYFLKHAHGSQENMDIHKTFGGWGGVHFQKPFKYLFFN